MKREVKWEDSIWLSVSVLTCLHKDDTHRSFQGKPSTNHFFPCSCDVVIVRDLLSVCQGEFLFGFRLGPFVGLFMLDCVCFALVSLSTTFF